MREGETRTEGAGTAGKGRQIGVESGTDVGGEERTTEVAEYRAGGCRDECWHQKRETFKVN